MSDFAPEQLYEIWAPPDSVWSPWVPPVFFTQVLVPAEPPLASEPEWPATPWYEGQRGAIVLDLPEDLSIRYGIALAKQGCRPVPMFNASPEPSPTRPRADTPSPPMPPEAIAQPAEWPATNARVSAALVQLGLRQQPAPTPPFASSGFVTLEMTALVRAFAQATLALRQLTIASNAPPVFLLDAMRLTGHRPPRPKLFDNRWMVFPQDFPSARFLKEQGIGDVLLVTNSGSPLPENDFAHVLLRWQQAGLAIWHKPFLNEDPPKPITVYRPSRFRALWYRALAIMGLRRNSAGGFGSEIPEPHRSHG